MENGAAAHPPHEPHEPEGGVRPLFLLADSQLLFHRDQAGLFLSRVTEALGEGAHAAAYLGASNGDVPDYYDIFVAAMEGIGIRDTKMIHAAPSDEERAYLERANVILLAGGDAARGYRAFRASGLWERFPARYAAGAVLMGISAGAMLLGQRAWAKGEPPFDGLRLAPAVVGAHEEPEWAGLTEIVKGMEGARGLGIPLGGGAVVYADWTVEPVRRTLVEIRVEEGEVKRAMLFPGAPSAV